ncbi:hypothetical protein FGG08_003903 [Glutinoglossum americanum]|uniref:Fungal N-terminal domain-containing protein n=1 Tax=Glutinoglossum americanum TaxID=1670608 RepID=A0A9P8L305_9PEZI|nr:hypothetical protein FGG08_003903 [Glutinoglossum americanum]
MVLSISAIGAIATLAVRASSIYDNIKSAERRFKDVANDTQTLHQHLNSIVDIYQKHHVLPLGNGHQQLLVIIESCKRNFQELEDLVKDYQARRTGLRGMINKANFPTEKVATIRANLSQLRLDLTLYLSTTAIRELATGASSTKILTETEEGQLLAKEVDAAFESQITPGTPTSSQGPFDPNVTGKVPFREKKPKVIDWQSTIELSQNPQDLTTEGPSEENILDLLLVASTNMWNPRLVIFRKHDGRLRLVHVYRVPSAEGTSSQRIDSKLFDSAYMSFIPAYATPATSAPLILLLYDRVSAEEAWYQFKSVEDVLSVQQAVTGAMVKFNEADILWQLAKPGRNDLGGIGRVQIWYPKPLIGKSSTSEFSPPKSSMSGLSRVSTSNSIQPIISRASGFSTASTLQPKKLRLTDKPNAESYEVPQSLVILIYTIHREKYAYIYLQFEYVQLGGLACCDTPATCRHVVLHGDKMKVRIFYAESDGLEGLKSWDLGRVLSRPGLPIKDFEELGVKHIILGMPSDKCQSLTSWGWFREWSFWFLNHGSID